MLAQVRKIHRVSNEGGDNCRCPSRLHRVSGTRIQLLQSLNARHPRACCPTLESPRKHWATELFGDYDPETMLIRLWMRTAVRKEITVFRNIPGAPCATNSAIISTFSGSDFRTHGTLAASTSAPLRCTTMRGEHRQSDCSGCQQRAGAGGSTGRERIEGRDPSGFRGDSYLCSIYRNVRLIRG